MVEKKRTDEGKPPETGNPSPRTREASKPFRLLGNAYVSEPDVSPQLTEETNESLEESDPPIVVRDGKTDHMAKGRADGQRNQSTDARGKNVPTRSVSSTLIALNRKAIEDKNHRFKDLYRLIDLQMLYTSYRSLQRNAAPGVDGVTYEDYESNVDERLRTLLDRLKSKRYRAQPVRRHYIPKGNTGKQRPLGIPALEDKIVQHAASQILERIYEADFSEHSWGYRRGKPGAREASKELARTLDCGTYRWIVEADIKSFFDEVDHEWLTRMLEQRINDRAFIGLIRKWLKAGVLEPGANRAEASETGTPQGGIISPILANIYLHHVLDLWIERVIKKKSKGQVIFMRYADDIIVGFEYADEAQNYLNELPTRLAKFHLRLAEEKSSLVKFNRWEPDESGKFTFLGFDFYWGRMRKNRKYAMVKRRTSRKKYQASLAAMKDWIRKARNWPLRMILSSLRKRLRGYWNYYCVISNSAMTWRYNSAVMKLVFKWLNRRSQRKSYTWEQYKRRWLGHWQIPGPRTVETPMPHERTRKMRLA